MSHPRKWRTYKIKEETFEYRDKRHVVAEPLEDTALPTDGVLMDPREFPFDPEPGQTFERRTIVTGWVKGEKPDKREAEDYKEGGVVVEIGDGRVTYAIKTSPEMRPDGLEDHITDPPEGGHYCHTKEFEIFGGKRPEKGDVVFIDQTNEYRKKEIAMSFEAFRSDVAERFQNVELPSRALNEILADMVVPLNDLKNENYLRGLNTLGTRSVEFIREVNLGLYGPSYEFSIDNTLDDIQKEYERQSEPEYDCVLLLTRRIGDTSKALEEEDYDEARNGVVQIGALAASMRQLCDQS